MQKSDSGFLVELPFPSVQGKTPFPPPRLLFLMAVTSSCALHTLSPHQPCPHGRPVSAAFMCTCSHRPSFLCCNCAAPAPRASLMWAPCSEAYPNILVDPTHPPPGTLCVIYLPFWCFIQFCLLIYLNYLFLFNYASLESQGSRTVLCT